MASYSGEGNGKYFSEDEARKRIYRSETIAWTTNILTKHKKHDFIDNEMAPMEEQLYFLSFVQVFSLCGRMITLSLNLIVHIALVANLDSCKIPQAILRFQPMRLH
jgi:hypothetical protein